MKKLPKRNKDNFCLSLDIKSKVYFLPIMPMSSWSRRVKTHGLKSSIEVQPGGAATKSKWQSDENIIFLLLCDFRMLLLCFDGENGSFVTIAYFSRLRVRSLIASYGGSKVAVAGVYPEQGSPLCDTQIQLHHDCNGAENVPKLAHRRVLAELQTV